jgi:ribonuclease VapC
VTLILDTSAITAVVLGEPDAEAYLAIMVANAGDLAVSAATAVETAIVIEARQGRAAAEDLRLLTDRLGVVTAPFDQDQARLAVLAWRRFGKGKHPAALNLGDCFSYALATASSSPLLFKGANFTQTDVLSAM